MNTHSSNYTGRAYRSMKAAFGPYTDDRLHPMPEPKPKHDAADLALYIVALIALLVVIHFAN
jgi:hypothetical protein